MWYRESFRSGFAVLAVVLMLTSLLVACGPASTSQIVVVTVTPSPSSEVVPTNTPISPPPTDTAVSEPSAPLPTVTLMPDTPTVLADTPTLPTDTPVSDTPTPSLPTDTAVPDTPTPVPPKRPTSTPSISYPAPTLLAPQEKDAGSLLGQVTFKWSYPRKLNPNEAFQVLIWKQGQPHDGAAELTTETQQTINLDTVLPSRGGPGDYFWTIVLREKRTEKILSPEAAPWRLTYIVDPCIDCNCKANCRSGNCKPCCDQCCNGCQ